jgi:hypothetical protein
MKCSLPVFAGEEQDIFDLSRAYQASGQYQRAIHIIRTNKSSAVSLRCINLAAQCHLSIEQFEEVLALIGKEPSEEEISVSSGSIA